MPRRRRRTDSLHHSSAHADNGWTLAHGSITSAGSTSISRLQVEPGSKTKAPAKQYIADAQHPPELVKWFQDAGGIMRWLELSEFWRIPQDGHYKSHQ